MSRRKLEGRIEALLQRIDEAEGRGLARIEQLADGPMASSRSSAEALSRELLDAADRVGAEEPGPLLRRACAALVRLAVNQGASERQHARRHRGPLKTGCAELRGLVQGVAWAVTTSPWWCSWAAAPAVDRAEQLVDESLAELQQLLRRPRHVLR